MALKQAFADLKKKISPKFEIIYRKGLNFGIEKLTLRHQKNAFLRIIFNKKHK